MSHVIFGTGAVGMAVMETLVDRGEQVRMINRTGSAEVPVGVDVFGGDASDPEFAGRAAAGATVVYQALNPAYTKWPELFPALQAGVLAGAEAAGAKLVVMDNVYGYGRAAGRPFAEDRQSFGLLRAKGRPAVQPRRPRVPARARRQDGPGVGRPRHAAHIHLYP